MRLNQALRVDRNSRVALVGAGGKTTALFQLARQMPGGAIVTTTTHLSVQQAQSADRHLILTDKGPLEELQRNFRSEVICITGPGEDHGRVVGLGDDLLAKVLHMADEMELPLFVEADGSRTRPLKAPASHEPVIPPWINQVIVCAGLSGLGKPVTASWVHRPEIFSGLSGLSLGELIDPESIVKVMSHIEGGLKGSPKSARRNALLNQADTVMLQSHGGAIARELVERGYHSALVASLGLNAEKTLTEHPASCEGPVYAVFEKIAGIVLAAGASRRMGTPKQLLEWRGHPLVWWPAMTALEAGLGPVVVITGSDADRVRQAVQDLSVMVIENHAWVEGQSSSVRAGLSALQANIGGAVFLLADQPHITRTLLRRLVEEHVRTRSPIIAPAVEDRRANPVLFDRDTFTALSCLCGDTGGRAIFDRYPLHYLPWLDASLLLDVDSTSDYRRLLTGDV